MAELKKCPFCGVEATLKMERKRDIGWTIWCECTKCCAKASGYCPNLSEEDKALDNIDACKKSAIEAWSRRVKE